MPVPVLRVIANPYTHVDPDGEPQGVCPCDPDGHTPDRKWVGAELDTERTVVHEKVGATEVRSARQTTKFKISAEPVSVPITRYYLRMLAMAGPMAPLFCADAETAKVVGVEFTPPAVALTAARDAAAIDWRAHHMTEPPFLATVSPAAAKAATKSPASPTPAPTAGS